MKKQMAMALGLAVLSGSAFASKARLEALGESANGSMYLDDARNAFINPASLNYNKNWMTLEFGDTSNVAEDSVSAPRAEGGVFMEQGNMVYGVYVGNEADDGNGFRAAAGTVGTHTPGQTTNILVPETNNLSLFAAGDAGVQWGVQFDYGASSHENDGAGIAYSVDNGTTDLTANDATQESNLMRIRGGIISGNIDAFLAIGIANTSSVEDKDNNVKLDFEGTGSMDLGVTYGLSNMDIMFRHSTITADKTVEAGTKTTTELEYARTELAVGSVRKLNDKATMNYKLAYVTESTANRLFQEDVDRDESSFALTLGMEVMAKDWLALRGSISQEILGVGQTVNKTATTEQTITNDESTVIAAGASLIFGDLSVDGLISTDTTGAGANGNAATNAGGNLRTDQLMSRVSLNYMF